MIPEWVVRTFDRNVVICRNRSANFAAFTRNAKARASASADEQAFGPDEPRLCLVRSIIRCKDGS
jgi:hypothetical protein